MEEEKDAEEIMQNYRDEMRFHCLEGEQGVTALNKLCRDLGYKDEGFRNGSSIEEFLKDNSGCCEAIVTWITEFMEHHDEWKEALTFEENPPDDN